MVEVRGRVERLGPRGWTAFAALTFGAGGALTAVLVSIVILGAMGVVTGGLIFGVVIAPGAGVGAMTIGGPLWGVIVELRRTYSERTGAIVGGLTGLLAYFSMALFYSLVSHGLSSSIPTITNELVRSVVTSLLILVSFGGIFTVPVGAFIGWQLVRVRRYSVEKSSSGDRDETASE